MSDFYVDAVVGEGDRLSADLSNGVMRDELVNAEVAIADRHLRHGTFADRKGGIEIVRFVDAVGAFGARSPRVITAGGLRLKKRPRRRIPQQPQPKPLLRAKDRPAVEAGVI